MTEPTREQLEAAVAEYENYGYEVFLPWKSDMDDEEKGHFEGFKNAIGAALAVGLKHLSDALQQQEKAEEAHANCDECDGEEVPELCPKCFPLYDNARIARRAALRGVSFSQADQSPTPTLPKPLAE